MRKQITPEQKEKNEFIQERRLVPMDLRCKTRMCNYGTCRNEFYVHELSNGCRLYCHDHKDMARILAQTRYRKTISKDTYKQRNAKWKAKYPNYHAEYYMKNRAKNIAYAQAKRDYAKARRDEKKALKQAEKLRSITHG